MNKKDLIFVLQCIVTGTISLTAFSCFAFDHYPDTGQTNSYTDTFGEDSDYTINNPTFTKMDALGNDLPDSAVSWSMVRDNVTGLLWETKTDDDSIHDKDNIYTWCDTNPDTNGGNQGSCGEGTDTEDFIATLNAAIYGGYSDWRVPARQELLSIINYGRTSPAAYTDYFPNTKSSGYWTATTYAGGYSLGYCDNSSSCVWAVSFAYGGVLPQDKSATGWSGYVRAVRGGY